MMHSAEQIPLILDGSALKSAGMSLALEHAEESAPGWAERTLEALRIFCVERKRSGTPRFAFEEFRATRRHDEPVTHKAWGSVPVKAAHLGVIRSTGDYRKAESAKTRDHPVLVWLAL